MRAINHALTGACIGLIVGEPLIAVPAALASHFICDAIPHYDESTGSKTKWVASSRFRNLLIIDTLLCLALVGLLALKEPPNWQLAAVCAFVAATPDFLSIPQFTAAVKKRKPKKNSYQRFAGGIQWFERPIGAAVEVAWACAAIIILVPFFR